MFLGGSNAISANLHRQNESEGLILPKLALFGGRTFLDFGGECSFQLGK